MTNAPTSDKRGDIPLLTVSLGAEVPGIEGRPALADHQLAQLIHQFREAVRTQVATLAAHFRVKDLLDGRKKALVPRSGQLPSGLRFEFHGAGCRICDTTCYVDFDFLPDGSPGGFDGWRLHWYIRENRLMPTAPSPQDLDAALARLADMGVLNYHPSRGLYDATAP